MGSFTLIQIFKWIALEEQQQLVQEGRDEQEEVRDILGLRESPSILKCMDSLGGGLQGGREGSKPQGAAQHASQVPFMGLSTQSWKIQAMSKFEVAKVSLGGPMEHSNGDV